MNLMLLLIIGACLALGLALVAAVPRRPARDRLLRLADRTRAPRPVVQAGSLLSDEVPGWVMRLLRVFAGKAAASPGSVPDQLRSRLVAAGYRRSSAPTVFMGGRLALALGLPFLVLLIPAAFELDQLQLVTALGMATGLGYVFPGYWVDKQKAHRQRSIEESLPDALDLMVVCVQAGLGILASLDRVVRDMSGAHPILCAELELAIYEIRAGKSTAEGLRALADRTGVSEVSSLVAMLVQTERFGTSIADTLRVHADSLRSRRMQRAEELANKAPLKMLFPTTLIFAASLVVTIGPAVIGITDFFKEH